MCGVKYLHCGVCECTDKFAFVPCDEYIQENVTTPQGSDGKAHPFAPGERFHCPNFKWPLEQESDKVEHVCEGCMYVGREFFEPKIKDEFEAEYGRYFDIRQFSFTYDVADEETMDAYLPSEFHKMSAAQKEMFLSIVMRHLCDDAFWNRRSEDFANRQLFIYMPDCHVCHAAIIDPDIEGLDEVEISPNIILRKWLSSLARSNATLTPLVENGNSSSNKDKKQFETKNIVTLDEAIIETNIITGFIHKVCSSCIDREQQLRAIVHQHLIDNTDAMSTWGVAMWLQQRGVGDIPMWHHCALKVGLPNTGPPSIKEVLALMSSSWKRLTGGIGWEDTIYMPPPVSISIPCSIHADGPLLHLYQWPEYARHRIEPTRQNPVRVHTRFRFGLDCKRIRNPVDDRIKYRLRNVQRLHQRLVRRGRTLKRKEDAVKQAHEELTSLLGNEPPKPPAQQARNSLSPNSEIGIQTTYEPVELQIKRWKDPAKLRAPNRPPFLKLKAVFTGVYFDADDNLQRVEKQPEGDQGEPNPEGHDVFPSIERDEGNNDQASGELPDAWQRARTILLSNQEMMAQEERMATDFADEEEVSGSSSSSSEEDNEGDDGNEPDEVTQVDAADITLCNRNCWHLADKQDMKSGDLFTFGFGIPEELYTFGDQFMRELQKESNQARRERRRRLDPNYRSPVEESSSDSSDSSSDEDDDGKAAKAGAVGSNSSTEPPA